MLIIFDLDGTLLNTIDDLAAACNFALSQLGYATHATEAYRAMVGNGVRRLVERALPLDARKDEVIDKALRLFAAYYDVHCCDASAPYPYIKALLADLTNRGVDLAVASNKYHSATQKLIQHYFPDANWKAIEGQKQGVPIKPDPSIVFEILQQCPTPKSQVIYVGDSAVDIETARRACVASVAVGWGFRSADELKAAHPDFFVDDPDEIIDIMLNPMFAL